MTDKQIIIKEITECGFYCSKDDVERLYIYEVIKNTDEEWLKENPEETLLIDEWIYDYTDYDDRKVYNTSGTLVAVCNDSTNCKVYKIKDTKYKIYGNCGQFLIEDKPTYKEQLKRKEQECKRLKEEVSLLKESNSKLQPIEDVNSLEKHYLQQLDQLKAENKEYKNIIDKLAGKTIAITSGDKPFEFCDHKDLTIKQLKADKETYKYQWEKQYELCEYWQGQAEKYKQALQDIEEIIKKEGYINKKNTNC